MNTKLYDQTSEFGGYVLTLLKHTYRAVEKELQRDDLTESQRRFLMKEITRIETDLNYRRTRKFAYLLEQYRARSWS